MRAHYGLDALDSYRADDDDPERSVTNPARRDADRVLGEARRSLREAEATEGRASLSGQCPSKEILDAFADAKAEVERLERSRSAIRPRSNSARFIWTQSGFVGERKPHLRRDPHGHLQRGVVTRALAYPALRPSRGRGQDAPSRAFKSPADLQVIGKELHVNDCSYVMPPAHPGNRGSLSGNSTPPGLPTREPSSPLSTQPRASDGSQG